MVGLDDLRKVLRSERETGRLTQIQPDLYERAHTSIAALLEKVYAIEDPLSDQARTLIEETVSIRETACDLFNLRTKKILSLAESHTQGQYIDREEIKKMIRLEREMFDRITGAIGTCQGVLVKNIRQTSLAIPPDEDAPPDQETTPPGPAEAPPVQPAAAPAYALVRVLSDMDAFMGVDGKTYTLARGDIVMLPELNADVLVERNIALNMNLCK